MDRRKVVALVPAAGRGLRMGTKTPKQFLGLGGVPLLVHSLRAFEVSEVVTEVILAVPAEDREYCRDEIVARHRFSKVRRIVAGGKQRQDSVRHALTEVTSDTDLVLVHDAVRPFLTEDMIVRVTDAADRHGGAIIAIPARDTLKQVGADYVIERTIDRTTLWQAQTPQAFRRAVLQKAHDHAMIDGYTGTDEADLVERIGAPVVVVEGSGDNIKITRPEDLIIGEAILAARH
ncbi:MAG: 2-C-methyl-D-erythritol 4-phosphate cytidylyltransferase [Nitrospiraceae bacterium]